MAAVKNNKKPARKKKSKSRTKKRIFFALLRRWSLPLIMLLFMGFSLAAAFYLIFLHAPSTPLF